MSPIAIIPPPAADSEPVVASGRWLLAQCATWLLSFLLLELHLPPLPQPLEARGLDLIQAISAQLLPFFLAANLMTGAVNLSIRTLDADDGTAAAILVLYLAVLCAGATAVSARRARLREREKEGAGTAQLRRSSRRGGRSRSPSPGRPHAE